MTVNSMQFEPAVAGGWVAVTAGRRTLAVGTLPHAGFVAAVSAALAEEDGVQRVLDLLTARGISLTPSFALLEFHNGTGALRVIVRGGVAVSVASPAGSETLDGSGVSTWTERDIDGASRVAVSVAGAVAAGVGVLPLVVGSALVAGFELTRVISPPPVPVPAPAPAAPQAPAPVSAEFTEITQVAEEDVPEPDEPELAEPGPAEPAGTAIAERESAARDENAERAAADADAADADAADAGDDDAAADNDAAADAPRESATPAAAAGVVDPDDKTVVMTSRRTRPPLAGDHDGQTVLTSDIAELRARRAAPSAPAAPPAPLVTLVLANGAREPLTGPILVGRAPSVTQVSGGQMPRLLTVGGTDQDISRTHVRFALEGGTVVVTDLHSRNGTTYALPGNDPQQLRAGEPTSVIVGTVIDLGSGVTFTVDEA